MEAAVLSDHRVGGLSWSDGKAAPQVYASLPLPAGFEVSAQATAARGAQRHGGADAAVKLAATYGGEAGLLRWHAGLAGHVFPGGAGDQDFVEMDTGLGGAIGPLDLALSARYAPPQDAIGGSNLRAGASAQMALIGTPFTLTADLGRSSGSTRDPLRAARLRPGGTYIDWSLGGRYTRRNLSVSLRYSDTDIAPRDVVPTARAGHYGATLVAGLHLAL